MDEKKERSANPLGNTDPSSRVWINPDLPKGHPDKILSQNEVKEVHFNIENRKIVPEEVAFEANANELERREKSQVEYGEDGNRIFPNEPRDHGPLP